MIKTKNLVALSLAATIVATPMAINAEKVTINNNTNIENSVEDIKGNYIKFSGTIKEVNLENGEGSILVEGEDKDLVFHISDNVLVADMTKTKERKLMHLEEGAEIIAFYGVNTPMTMSIPGQLTPEVIVVKNGEMNVKVDNFDEDLLSSDESLKLNIKEDEDNYKNKTLLVYWTTETLSIPPQANPELIVVLENQKVKDEDIDENIEDEDKSKLTNLNRVIINEKSLELPLISENDIVLIPVREIAESLGYDVIWNGHNNPIEISKGAQWTSIQLGDNSYTFAKMSPFELEKAPKLINSKTYVPVSFINEVLKTDTNINEGTLEIKSY